MAVFTVFFKKMIFFSNIGFSVSISCKIYLSFRIWHYFVLKINISGATNVFVALGIKKLQGNVKIFLLIFFPSSSLKHQIVAPF